MASGWLTSLGAAGPASRARERQHQDVIYAPVPEPETYAMLLAGLAAWVRVTRATAQRPSVRT